MTTDIEGYGPRSQAPVARLLEDLDTFSAASVERAADAWRELHHARGEHLDAALDSAQQTAASSPGGWDEIRDAIARLTTGRSAQIAWREVGPEVSGLGMRAALAAAAALVARDAIERATFELLLRPMTDVLPWLHETAHGVEPVPEIDDGPAPDANPAPVAGEVALTGRGRGAEPAGTVSEEDRAADVHDADELAAGTPAAGAGGGLSHDVNSRDNAAEFSREPLGPSPV